MQKFKQTKKEWEKYHICISWKVEFVFVHKPINYIYWYIVNSIKVNIKDDLLLCFIIWNSSKVHVIFPSECMVSHVNCCCVRIFFITSTFIENIQVQKYTWYLKNNDMYRFFTDLIFIEIYFDDVTDITCIVEGEEILRYTCILINFHSRLLKHQ